jgi:hypothetical protein
MLIFTMLSGRLGSRGVSTTSPPDHEQSRLSSPTDFADIPVSSDASTGISSDSRRFRTE